MNIRQSQPFADHLKRMGWIIEQIDGVNFFIRRLPFFPPVIKLQRPDKLLGLTKIYQLIKKYRARRVDVEPLAKIHKSSANIKPMFHPYNQTKTIHIDLMKSESEIFNSFTEAKRRAVRKAEKNSVRTEISQNINLFIKIKNKSAGYFLPFLTDWTIKPLWTEFAPRNADVVFSYILKNGRKEFLGGILLLKWEKTAYYWMAGYTKAAKRLSAPTHCVWEALKFARKKGCTMFDFEGIFDERLPGHGRDWKGFSKFKMGFGGKVHLYPLPYHIYRLR